MDIAADYGLFLAKLVTFAAVLAALGAAAAALVARARAAGEQQLEVRDLNRKYETMALTLHSAMLPRRALRQQAKRLSRERKRRAAAAAAGEGRRRVFVLRFRGDLRASAVASLREEVSAVLEVARPRDEVVVVLESGGGTVHGYGLAASQLARVKARGIPLTVAVDKVAASGGYMMACVADRILAAPFAVLGSIGVVGQLPNFHRFLERHDIDYELHTAGELKRSLTLFGENTDAARARFREELAEAHRLFKAFVQEHRPVVDIEAVATGEYWFGRRALALKLVDELRTSDDYLLAAAREADLYELRYTRRRTLLERLTASGQDL